MTSLPDLTAAFEDAGLIDVAYTIEPSPVGDLLVAVTPRGLLTLSYNNDLSPIAASISPRILYVPARTDSVRRQLEEYFARKRQSFDLDLDFRLARQGFGRRVLAATARIPYGQVSTYKGVATEAGSPRAFRAAGTALGANPLPVVVPCHRVLHADGGLGGYTGGVERKQTLLALEGVTG
ncbi:MAG: methylated-DNA--[protein]-cysteine S-methyltransferase [Solirubrobacterales bacterium]|nr:methylated-DNA--[protein]-cysteine S-methyltransferase [Solirubrobacterales bacterium]